MSDRLRVQRCDNCDKWKNPESLVDVDVTRNTEFVRSMEGVPKRIVETVVERWCVTCFRDVSQLI